jgi:hypothetical protein
MSSDNLVSPVSLLEMTKTFTTRKRNIPLPKSTVVLEIDREENLDTFDDDYQGFKPEILKVDSLVKKLPVAKNFIPGSSICSSELF